MKQGKIYMSQCRQSKFAN